MKLIAKNIINIANEINQFKAQFKLSQPVKLVVVTKGRNVTEIEAAIASGVCDFAENYLQEALEKWQILKQKYPHIRLHFIGGLQTNKLNKILNIFDVIQSIDRITLVDKIINTKTDITNKDFFIEIKATYDHNTASDRKGVSISQAQSLIEYALSKGLKISGLMGIAPLASEYITIQYFKQLYLLQKNNLLPELSIGMSKDYLLAIKYGSTMVRIGSKIFNT